MDASHALQAHYDAILASSSDAIRKNQLDLDPNLNLDPRLPTDQDTRRGLTVIARPDDALAARLTDVLDRLEPVAPGQ